MAQKPAFGHPTYFLMYTMLVNEPYTLVKYVFIKRNIINLKHFRCFLSYMIKEDVISKARTLEFGKRLFFMIYKTIVRNRRIEEMIDTFKDVHLSINIDMSKI